MVSILILLDAFLSYYSNVSQNFLISKHTYKNINLLYDSTVINRQLECTSMIKFHVSSCIPNTVSYCVWLGFSAAMGFDYTARKSVLYIID